MTPFTYDDGLYNSLTYFQNMVIGYLQEQKRWDYRFSIAIFRLTSTGNSPLVCKIGTGIEWSQYDDKARETNYVERKLFMRVTILFSRAQSKLKSKPQRVQIY